MGVAGCGKTTIGKLLASQLNMPFYDGDEFHPPENVKKMENGIPLNDSDRKGWLGTIHKFVKNQVKTTSLVFACSALKVSYRSQLSDGLHALWIHLEGKFNQIEERMKHREGHYMPAELLQSQFDTLEVPNDAISVSTEQSPECMVNEILAALGRN